MYSKNVSQIYKQLLKFINAFLQINMLEFANKKSLNILKTYKEVCIFT